MSLSEIYYPGYIFSPVFITCFCFWLPWLILSLLHSFLLLSVFPFIYSFPWCLFFNSSWSFVFLIRALLWYSFFRILHLSNLISKTESTEKFWIQFPRENFQFKKKTKSSTSVIWRYFHWNLRTLQATQKSTLKFLFFHNYHQFI